MRVFVNILFFGSIFLLSIIYLYNKIYQLKPIGKIISCTNSIQIIGTNGGIYNSKNCPNKELFANNIIITNGKAKLELNNQNIIVQSGTILKIKPKTNGIQKIFLLIGEIVFPEKNKIQMLTPVSQLILKGDILSAKASISGSYYILNIKKTNSYQESSKFLIKKYKINILQIPNFKADILQKQSIENIENLIILVK